MERVERQAVVAAEAEAPLQVVRVVLAVLENAGYGRYKFYREM